MGASPREIFRPLEPIGLDELNERAALQRRTDNKYIVQIDRLAALVNELGRDLRVLEIDGERLFEYESTYFDTPSLRCFHDHVEDRTPRFKARTRCYVTTGDCFFEVKVKRPDGETVKEHVEYHPDDRQAIRPEAHELIEKMLAEYGIELRDEEMRPTLVTRFRRATVVARERPERTTFDFDVELDAPGHGTAAARDGLVVAETKTRDGSGSFDRALQEAGFEPVSLSKYRMGVGLLLAPGAD